MANYKLGVDSSSNVKIYKSDYVAQDDVTLIGDISGLANNLITGDGVTSATLPSGITASVTDEAGSETYTITLGEGASNSADATTSTITVTAVPGKTVSLKVAEGFTSTINHSATAENGTIVLKSISSTGWYKNASTDNSFKYDNGNSQTASTASVTISNGIKSNVSDNDFTFSGTTLTLKKSAFADEITDNTKIDISSNSTFTLALASEGNDKVSAPGTVTDTPFTWGIKEVKDGETVKSITATLQKELADGWTLSNNKVLTYTGKKTMKYAKIEGLDTDTTATSIALPASTTTGEGQEATTSDNTAGAIKLTAAVIPAPTTGSATVTLTNETSGTDVVASSFTLALGDDIKNRAPQNKENGTIALTFETPASGATSKTAKVVQTMTEGWTLDTTNGSKKITYTPTRTAELATIEGLALTADDTNVTLNNKEITLKYGSVTTSDVTLERTATETLKTKDTSYADGDANYILNVDGNSVQSTANPDGTYKAQVTTVDTNKAKVEIKANYEAYWELGSNNSVEKTKVTYHAAGPDAEVLATVTGLKKDAKEGTDFVINTDNGDEKIVLNKSAFPTESLTSGTTTVTLGEGSNFSLELGGDVQAENEATAVTVTGTEGGNTFTVVQPYTDAWKLQDKTVTYTTRISDELATITVTNGATGIKASHFTVDGNVVTVAKEALDAAANSGAGTTVSIAKVEGASEEYTLALGEGLTKFGAEKTDAPVLEVKADENTGEDKKGDRVALVKKALVDGWYIPTEGDDEGKSITFKKDQFKILATVTGLASGAVYNSTTTDGSNTVTLANGVITLKRAALPAESQTYSVTTLANEEGQTYKLAFGTDVTDTDKAPGTTYTGTPTLTINEGSATIKGTLNGGWELDDENEPTVITYTKQVADRELATISGLGDSATTTNVKLGTVDGSAAGTTKDTNVVYVQLAALGEGNVTLDNVTVTGANDEVINIGDFKFRLKKDDAATAGTELGYEPNYAWQIDSTDSTTAYFVQGKEKGWTVITADGNNDPVMQIAFNRRVDPTEANSLGEDGGATAILTVTGLIDDENVTLKTNDSALAEADYKDPTKSAIGTTDDNNNFVAGLQVSTAYTAADSTTTPATTAANGKILLKRNVLGKDTLQLSGADNAKYDLALFDDAKDASANDDTFVPTSTGATINYWFVNGNAALYKEATPEYWKLDGKKVTYTARADKNILARIEGIANTADFSVKDGSAFAAAKAYSGTDGGKYTITGGFVYKGNKDADAETAAAAKVIEMTNEYVAGTTPTLGTITLGKEALNEKDVTFTAGSDKYNLALTGVTEATVSGNKWAVTGTDTKTATYYDVYDAGYKVVDKASATATAGKTIKYFDGDEKSDYEIATITGLNKDVAADETSGALGTNTGTDGDFEAFDTNEGIQVKETTISGTNYNAFVLPKAVLGTKDVTLTLAHANEAPYKLAIGDDALDIDVAADKKTIEDKANVWRLDGTTATYRNITPTYYKRAADAMSITTTAEAVNKTYATVSNLPSGVFEENGMIFSEDDDTKDKYTQLLTVDTDTPNIITVAKDALNDEDANELTLKNGDATYSLVLGDGITPVSVESGGNWDVSGTTATYKATLAAGWLVSKDGTTVTHYDEKSDHVIATIRGLKSGSDTFNPDVNTTFTTAGDYYIAIPKEALGTTDITLKNGTLQNDVEFAYGIKLSEETDEAKAAATTAITGVPRWSLDGTTLSLNNIHDAHHEDETTKQASTTGIDKTTIKYVAEKVDDATVTLTNLADDLSLTGTEDDIVNGRQTAKLDAADGDKPIDGITVQNRVITVNKEELIRQDASKPLTLTNKTGATSSTKYSLTKDSTVKSPEDGGESFKLESGKATLYSGKTAGYVLAGTKDKITYAEPTQVKEIATITGIKTDGFVVGGNTATDKNQIGYYEEKPKEGGEETETVFVPVITYETESSAKKFTIGKDALTNSDVEVNKGTLAFKSEEATDNRIGYDTTTAYEWKVSGTTATFNKGNTAGWELPTSGDNKTIKYHAAAYDTVVATISNLKSGLKPGTVTTDVEGQDPVITYGLLDSKKNLAVSEDNGTFTLTSYAVNAKDILLAVAKDPTDSTKALDETKNFKLALDATKETVDGVEQLTEAAVKGKVVTPVWKNETGGKYTYTVTTEAGYDSYETILDGTLTDEEKAADKKAALTVNKVVYDDRIIYTKAGKNATTLTGLKDSLTISKTNTDNDTLAGVKFNDDADNPTVTVVKDSLGEKNIVLKNGSIKYVLELNGVDPTAKEVWNISKGTATYVQPYSEKNYIRKSNTEYTYSAGKKEVALATITGFDTTISETGLSADEAKETYGIEVKTDHVITEAVVNATTNEVTTPAVMGTAITLSDRSKLAAKNIVLKATKDAETQYVFDVDVKKNFDTITYTAKAPLWTFSKGTLTLSDGTSGKWAYKSATDHNTLTYTRGKTTAVATVKGLATDLVLKTDTNGQATENGHGLFAAPAEQNAGTLAATGESTPVLTIDTDAKIGKIQLTSGALVAAEKLKNNAKVTLTQPKTATTDFVLDTIGVGKATADDMAKKNEAAVAYTGQANMWSISKGTATYHHTDSAGWQLDSTGKTFTYTDAAKTTNILKISGLATTADMTTLSATEKDNKGNALDVPIKESDFETKTGIILGNKTKDDGTKEQAFTLTDATKLAASNVTLSVLDKTAKYGIYADASLKPTDFAEKVTVDGKKGSVTLTAGTSAGYTNATGNNEGKRVTFSKETTSKTLFSVTGLKKDTDATFVAANKTLADYVTVDNGGKITTGSALTYENNKITVDSFILDKTASLSGTGGYTFGELKGDNIDDTNTPIMIVKSGTINIVDRADEGKYAISTDGKKINKNTKNVDTILATVKGLNKNLAQKTEGATELYIATTKKVDGKTVTEYGDSSVGLFEFGASKGSIKLSNAALADADVKLTLGKTAKEGDYKVTLDSTEGGVMMKSGNWKDITEWTVSKGTATYRTYNKGYYASDDKGGFKYTKETKGNTFATINGLSTDTAKEAAIAKSLNDSTTAGLYSAISIKNDMLAEKNIVLKNVKDKTSGDEGAFTIALAADANDAKSTLKVGSAFVSGKLTATQSIGYVESSDTQITYLKADKTNQTIATLTGVNTKKDISVTSAKGTNTISLAGENLANKSVTLTVTDLAAAYGYDYKLALSGVDAPKVTAAATNPWTVKNGTATFNGFITDGYTLAASEKSVTYTKAAGSDKQTLANGKTKDAVYKALMTVKGVSDTKKPTENAMANAVALSSATAIKLSDSTVTISTGLFPVEFSGTSITGSKEADTIEIKSTKAVTVEPGKGDDNITLKNGNTKDTFVYANGDGHDIVANFTADDTIKLKSGKLTSVEAVGNAAVVKVGTGSITLNEASTTKINIVDNKGNSLWSAAPTSSSDVLLADDNYSMDAAALSDIVEPFHASYTPYDFESGLDLVKKDSFTPALTYTGTSDKK